MWPIPKHLCICLHRMLSTVWMKAIVFVMLDTLVRQVETHVCRVQKVHTNQPLEIFHVWFAVLYW
jgi:hypothetical protein